jgi:hypothetical protein
MGFWTCQASTCIAKGVNINSQNLVPVVKGKIREKGTTGAIDPHTFHDFIGLESDTPLALFAILETNSMVSD